MLGTTLVFLALTALFVALHVRGSRGGAPAAAKAPKAAACPRCKVAVPSSSTPCPRCGVPPQVFDLVAAPAAKAETAAPAGPVAARLHAVVRADVCVGCGTCVSVCPEPGALHLEGKVAVVDTAVCKAHGDCVKACPVGGIFLSSGAAVQRVEVPQVNFDFESTVPGIFIVGELGGRGLIKNAINEGKLAVEAVARRVAGGAVPPSGLVYDLVIAGSGPAGLSAALEAMDRGLRYVVLEQGAAAESIRRYPRHKVLLAEPVDLPLYGDLWVADSSKESLLAVWENVIQVTGLDVRAGHKVVDVKRESWGFQVVTESATFPARHVVLAMGRRGSPRKLGVPGEELSKVVYEVVEMEVFAGRRVLVVGGGDSAIESVLGLSRQQGTAVHLSYRGESFDRAKERNRTKLSEVVAAGRARLLLRTQIREIRPDAVILETPEGPRSLPNDDVVVRIGGEAPHAFLDKIGVRRVVKELAVALVLALAAGYAPHAAAQVSPGPLSRAHRELNGNANCLKCHASKKEGMDGRCMDCHRDIALLREAGRGLHARVADRACAKCHPDHAGEDFDLVDFAADGPREFDHSRAGFPLDGKHAGLKCRDCHQPKYRKGPAAAASKIREASRSWVGLEPACASCHLDPHKGALGEGCSKCHTPADWHKTTTFDHAKTDFPLLAKHAGVACAKCHQAEGLAKPVYKPLPHAECSACHRDPHAGRLGPKCASCHNAASFKDVPKTSFDHDRTRYPLRGAHRTVACAACHDPQKAWGPKPAFAACGACHKDTHAGQATLSGQRADCAACHSVEGYKPGVLPVAQHAPGRFPLLGKHAAVACAKCHVRDTSAAGTARFGSSGVVMRPAHEKCAACHADAHGGQFASRPDGGACEPCHDASGWKPGRFGVEQHRATALPLDGAHVDAACAKCHVPDRKGMPVLRGVAKDCAGCHRDPHRFAKARACTECHDTRAFVPARIGADEHARYALPLEGAHRAVPCFVCHRELQRPPTTGGTLAGAAGTFPSLPFRDDRRTCDACHKDPHAGQFARGGVTACERCHVAAAFRPAPRFDHDRDAAFRLGNAHAKLACAKCHLARPGAAPVYKGTPARCEACHGARAVRTPQGGLR